MLSLTAQKAIAAYGGKELWQNHKYIEAEVSAHGLAFTLKRRPVFEHAIIKMDIEKPFCKLTPIGKNKNITGVLDGNDVRLVDENEKIIEERKNARSFFPFGRRLFYWDDLDMAYFANYAFWNYFTLPNLLLSENIKWIEKTEGLLEATFPPDFPTHNKIQEFIFDKETGLLKQNNYTVDIISTLAKAANVVIEHGKTNNLVYPSKRLVTPKGKSGKALGGPILIDITVHSFKLTNE
jgi:hypothetical protein